MRSPRSMMSLVLSLFALTAVLVSLTGGAMAPQTPARPAASTHMNINCATGNPLCAEVSETEDVFGEDVYVGHDEPSTLFYSNVPGSGNRMRYELTLPKDPPMKTAQSFNFQLHPAFWFGMAMCDTESFPEQIHTCTPNSDTNIVDPAVSSQHAGTAFMEMQFYPPGWVSWPPGNSCDATKWCAALNIDSLSQNSVTGQANNNACLAIAGIEPVNFAFITKNGKAQAPANPVDSTVDTFTPDPKKDLFMNSGDRLTVTMQDTVHGLRIDIHDLSTGQSGFMTASADNGFGQVKFDPAGTTCQSLPYDFHPMYSTSSEQTRVPWAAHSYNIAFSDEIGHWDYCNGPNSITPGGNCPTGNTEGIKGDTEPTDADDTFCFPASSSSLVKLPGCLGQNNGFDGVSYQKVWPNGNRAKTPTPVSFSSPLTGAHFDINYSRAALEADLPRIEANTCNRSTGAGCTLIPTTDDKTPAAFYPFFSTKNRGGDEWDDRSCSWLLGDHLPGANDFGGNAQYGPLLSLTYSGVGGVPFNRFNNFRHIFNINPCKADR